MAAAKCPHCHVENLYKCSKCNSVYCLSCKKMISGAKIPRSMGGMDKNCPVCYSFGVVTKLK